MSPKPTLALQIVMLVGCAVLVAQLACAFPYPAPIVRPFLDPRARWPEVQVRDWAKTGDFRGDYLEFFYRDPDRTIPAGNNIVAPADGVLRYLDLDGGKRHVVIGLSLWDVHVQRAPCDGVITAIADAGDTFMDGEGDRLVYLREKVCPVQKIISMRTAWGDLELRLITSLSARRLEVWPKPGQRVAKGERIGRILAGSTVVLALPESVPVLVERGERVVAGETILCGEGAR